jgi:hypothetical protein
VGSRSKRLRRGVVALACVVIAATAAGRAAAQGPPKPERSPSPGLAPIHPEAAPSASEAQKSDKGVSSSQGSGSQGSSTRTYTPPSTGASRQAVTFPRAATSQVRKAQIPMHRTAKKDPPARLPTKPVESIAAAGGQILVTSAHGLTKTPSSSESLLLLLVGLALVVLVVGETTFLRLVARRPARQRAAEEPLPIRRVQLRR